MTLQKLIKRMENIDVKGASVIHVLNSALEAIEKYSVDEWSKQTSRRGREHAERIAKSERECGE